MEDVANLIKLGWLAYELIILVVTQDNIMHIN